MAGFPKPVGGSAIKPVNVSTAGVHPLVKASMLPRMKSNKASGLVAQSAMMRAMARGNLTSGMGRVMGLVATGKD